MGLLCLDKRAKKIPMPVVPRLRPGISRFFSVFIVLFLPVRSWPDRDNEDVNGVATPFFGSRAFLGRRHAPLEQIEPSSVINSRGWAPRRGPAARSQPDLESRRNATSRTRCGPLNFAFVPHRRHGAVLCGRQSSLALAFSSLSHSRSLVPYR